jgi:hypothetical protein
MKRKIITDNASRTIKKKPKTEEQIKKAVAKYAVDQPLKFQLGTPVSPGQALGDYLKKKSDATMATILGHQVMDKAGMGHQDLINPKPYLGGQAVSSGGYQPWKPGNTPSAAEIEAMLHLLGGPVMGEHKSDDWAGPPAFLNKPPWKTMYVQEPKPKEKK